MVYVNVYERKQLKVTKLMLTSNNEKDVLTLFQDPQKAGVGHGYVTIYFIC